MGAASRASGTEILSCRVTEKASHKSNVLGRSAQCGEGQTETQECVSAFSCDISATWTHLAGHLISLCVTGYGRH